jgi:hypothetical protein
VQKEQSHGQHFLVAALESIQTTALISAYPFDTKKPATEYRSRLTS